MRDFEVFSVQLYSPGLMTIKKVHACLQLNVRNNASYNPNSIIVCLFHKYQD